MTNGLMTRRGLFTLATGFAAIAAFRIEAKAETAPRAAPVGSFEAAQAEAIPQSLEPVEEDHASRIAELQNSIMRICEASHTPPLPPSVYRLLFVLMATEVHGRGFAPPRTAEAVVARARRQGLPVAMMDVAFMLDALNEIDAGLEYARSPAALARAYREFVHTSCHHAGVKLSEDEHQLIQVWFGTVGGGPRQDGCEAALVGA
jgi:hypothetical protein